MSSRLQSARCLSICRLVERREQSWRAVVSGGAGYIGSHLVWALVERHWSVLVIDDLSTGLRQNLPGEAQLLVADMASTTAGMAIEDFSPDIIFQFAAKIRVDESFERPDLYWDVNLRRSGELFAKSLDKGVRHFVLSSTAAVYGEPDVDFVTEDTPARPISPYGRSKLASEWLLHDLCEKAGATYTVLRYFNVAGADAKLRTGPRLGTGNLISVAIEAMLGQRAELPIFGTDYDTPDGSCIRDFIHVTDLVDIHIRSAERLLRGGSSVCFNCGYGKGYSVKQIAERARQLASHPFRVSHKGRRKGDIVSMVANPERMKQNLGWAPLHEDLDFLLLTGFRWASKGLALAPV